MDISERKIRLIERILQVVSEDNISLFEEILENEFDLANAVVAHDINGKEITLQEYRDRNEQAIHNYKAGNYKTSDQLREKYEMYKKKNE